MEKKVFEFDFRGKKLVVEHGEVAKQADGAVLVREPLEAILFENKKVAFLMWNLGLIELIES